MSTMFAMGCFYWCNWFFCGAFTCAAPNIFTPSKMRFAVLNIKVNSNTIYIKHIQLFHERADKHVDVTA